jgi:hypothetical protein
MRKLALLTTQALFSLSLVALALPSLSGCDKSTDENADDDDDDNESSGDDDDDNGSSSAADDDDDEDGGECGSVDCSPGDPMACAEGEKCAPYICGSGCCTDTARCVEVLGDKAFDEDCTRDRVAGNDDCAPTLYCMPNDGTTGGEGPGKCMQFCDPTSANATQCDDLGVAGGHCFNFNNGTFPVCVPTCDPIAQDCEKAEQGCYFAVDNYFCTNPTDSISGDGGQGSECDTEQGCKAGFACAPKDLFADCTTESNGVINGCCSQYCDTSKDDECPTGMSCIDLEGDAPGLENVGVCGTPK